jgi:hypothetical protein
VSQQPFRKNPVMGLVEQISSWPPMMFRDVSRLLLVLVSDDMASSGDGPNPFAKAKNEPR